MLKTQFYGFLPQNKRQNKAQEEQKTEIKSSLKAKKKKPAEVVANLSLDGHGHEQRLIMVRLRGILLGVLTKISAS